MDENGIGAFFPSVCSENSCEFGIILNVFATSRSALSSTKLTSIEAKMVGLERFEDCNGGLEGLSVTCYDRQHW